MAADQAHDRVVAADSKPAATLALLQDWWTAFQKAEGGPAQEVMALGWVAVVAMPQLFARLG